jgi:hypothetical protein
MADSYLAISNIAGNRYMTERVVAAATQQAHLGNAPLITNPLAWTTDNRYLWASSPGWGEKWDSAVLSHALTPVYDPGSDTSVISDADILATVQMLGAEPPADG